MKIKSKANIENTFKYLEWQLDLFIMLVVPQKKLSRKQKHTLIYFIIASINKLPLSSSEANAFVRDHIDVKSDTDVYLYKNQLKRKGWFTVDETGSYQLIDNFNYAIKEFPLVKNYKFSLTLELKDEE